MPDLLVGSGADNSVNDIAVTSSGKIYIGGLFTTINGNGRGRIARLNADGSLDTGFLNGPVGANDVINAIALLSDEDILAAGNFTSFNGTSRNRISAPESGWQH